MLIRLNISVKKFYTSIRTCSDSRVVSNNNNCRSAFIYFFAIRIKLHRMVAFTNVRLQNLLQTLFTRLFVIRLYSVTGLDIFNVFQSLIRMYFSSCRETSKYAQFPHRSFPDNKQCSSFMNLQLFNFYILIIIFRNIKSFK